MRLNRSMDEYHDAESNLTGLTEPSESSTMLPGIDPSIARFPKCIVWTPLPIVSWLAPFFGHVGVCREDGTILDFAGPYFVNVDNFAFGAAARYVHLDGKQCCFPPHLSGHTCKSGFEHAQLGTSVSWDDGLFGSMQHFQHKSYNLFTCNCHSFVASFLNRIAYQGCIRWNVITVVLLIMLRGQWVSKWAVATSSAPFSIVMCLGLFVAGWPFLVGWAIFNLILIGWYILGTYVSNGLIDC